MEKAFLSFVQRIKNYLLISCCLLIFASCNTIRNTESDDSTLKQKNLDEQLTALQARENELSTREATIAAREKEITNVLAELQKDKKKLADQLAKQNTNRTTTKSASNAQQQKTSRNQTGSKNNQTILGELEHVFLEPPGINLRARIDTGAQTSSLNALNMVEFERDGKPYITFNIIDPETGKEIAITRQVRGYVHIKEHKGEAQRRPIVRIRVRLANIDERINFTLVDRSKFKQQVLIGRNFLRDIAIVDVSKEFTAPKYNQNKK